MKKKKLCVCNTAVKPTTRKAAENTFQYFNVFLYTYSWASPFGTPPRGYSALLYICIPYFFWHSLTFDDIYTDVYSTISSNRRVYVRRTRIYIYIHVAALPFSPVRRVASMNIGELPYLYMYIFSRPFVFIFIIIFFFTMYMYTGAIVDRGQPSWHSIHIAAGGMSRVISTFNINLYTRRYI